MTILLAPDKFKGSLDSFDVCRAMAEGIRQVNDTVNIISLPLADGGDGFAKVMAHYLHTTTIVVQTTNATGRSVEGSFEWSASSQTAIIEMATASGISQLTNEERNPLKTSTYGTGLSIKAAIENGAKKIILGIGGSASNDGGTGILSALGYRFMDENENELLPCGASLQHIKTIKAPDKIIDTNFIIACDVANPLLGANGAAFVYAAQKGASKAAIILLENGMRQYAMVLEKITGKSISEIPGMGAAGGTCASLMLLPKVTLQKGMDIVFEYSDFYNQLLKADYVFTGEGAFDKQTLNGKVVYAVAAAAKALNIPALAICGKVDADLALIKQCGLSYITSINNRQMSTEESMKQAFELVRFAAAKASCPQRGVLQNVIIKL